jgi:hypothetical protein
VNVILDAYVWLAPLLLLPLVGLLGFVGCNQVFGLEAAFVAVDPAVQDWMAQVVVLR